MIDQIRIGSGHRQGTSAGYEIIDGVCVLPPGDPMKGKDLEEDRRDVGDTSYMTTGRVPFGRG